jgi:hypothetical protein
MQKDKIFSYFKTSILNKLFKSYVQPKHVVKNIGEISEGEVLVIEGGPATGKTRMLNELMEVRRSKGDKVFYIDANKTIKEWTKDFNIFGKTSEQRMFYMINICSNAFVFIDNGDKITDSKVDAIIQTIEVAKGVVISCIDFRRLNPKIKNRIADAKLFSLGNGIEPLDITYIIVACLIIVMAVIGDVNFLFMAAAVRYMFHGFRYASKGQRGI